MPNLEDSGHLLEVIGVSKSYRGVKALIDCHFSCGRGEVHALLGENGAGKSTLVKIMCGVVKPDEGKIVFKGKETHIESPVDASKKGIVAVFQELSLVPELTVAENIYLGHEPRTKWGLIDFKKLTIMSDQLLSSLEFNLSSDSIVSELSLSDQQLVEIAKALSRDPEVIIFDEATSSLGKTEVDLLFSLIKKLTASGKTAIFISHRMDELERIADRATVFRDARFVSSFKWGSVGNDQIINMIAGRDVTETYPEKKFPEGSELALEINNLSAGRHFRGINLQVKKGEIIGIAGLQGHGQSHFLQALFGACQITDGNISANGKTIHLKNPKSALNAGIVLVPEDRKHDGLLLTRSIKENISLMTLDQRQQLGFIQNKKEAETLNSMISKLKIKISTVEQEAGSLSGGNQQKIVIGKTLLTGSNILLLSDPTRGIDIGTKADIYQLMKELAEQGMSIIFYSTELPELVGVCHRVAVFKQGQISAILTGSEITEKHIMNAALGVA